MKHETESNEALSEWKEGPHNDWGCGWLAKAQATARVDVPSSTAMLCFFGKSFDVVSLPIVERQPRGNVSGVDNRETRLLLREKQRQCLGPWPLFDPARCAHPPGESILWQTFHSQTSVLFQRSVFPLPLGAALRQQAIFLVS